MFNLFLEDMVFHNPDPTITGDVGYLTDSIDEYYSDRQVLSDTRSSRLGLVYNDQIFGSTVFKDYIIQNVYNDLLYQHNINVNDPNSTAIIDILLNELTHVVNDNDMAEGTAYNVNRSYSMNLHYDSTTLETTESNYLASMSVQEYDALFNIAERVMLGHLLQEDISTLDSVLSNDTMKYTNYYPGSVNVSLQRRLAHLHDSSLDFSVLVPPWVEFEIRKSGGYVLIVKIWFSKLFFETEYPYSVISAVIPPADCTTLLNLSTLPDVYAALHESRETTLEQLSSMIGPNKQYSGLIGHNLVYRSPGSSDTYVTTFMILYKGVEPSQLVKNQAIRNYLLDVCVVGTMYDWVARYPSLFNDNMYYLYPIWDTAFNKSNNEYFQSVVNVEKLNMLLNRIADVNPNADISEYDVLTSLYNQAYIIGTKDVDNLSSNNLDIVYPDYTRISVNDPYFSLFDIPTRNFIVNINKAVAKADGEENELTTTMVNGYKYVKFTVGVSEYLVMDRQHYNTMIML